MKKQLILKIIALLVENDYLILSSKIGYVLTEKFQNDAIKARIEMQVQRQNTLNQINEIFDAFYGD